MIGRSACSAVALFAAVAFAQAAVKPSCAVVGFVNELKNTDWKDARVGMGVRLMLSQSLAETGLFSFVEEKPGMKEKVEALSKALWAQQGGTTLESAQALGRESGAAFTASGKVFFFGKPRTKASVGPAHFQKDEVEIRVEVTLTDMKTGKSIVEIGKGVAATTAASGLFTFHEERLDVDASLVGTATRKAIDHAVGEVVKKYRKRYTIP